MLLFHNTGLGHSLVKFSSFYKSSHNACVERKHEEYIHSLHHTHFLLKYGESKVHPITFLEGSLYLISALDGGQLVSTSPSRFTPGNNSHTSFTGY